MNAVAGKIEYSGFTGHALWLAAAKFIAFALSFALPLLLVRKITQTEFGLYKQAFQILTTAVSLLMLQVSATAYYFIPRNPDKKPQIVFNVLLFYLLIGTVAAACFAFYPQWITWVFSTADLVPYMPLLGLTILIWVVASPYEIFMIATGEVRTASGAIVLMQILKTGLLLAVTLISGALTLLLWAAIIQGLIQLLLLVIWLKRRFGYFWQSPDWNLLKAQLANALPFGIGGIFYAAQLDLHLYFVAHYFDPADFAIYSVGCSQILPLIILFDSFETILLPEVARRDSAGDQKGIIKVWLKAVRQLFFVFLPVCLLLIVVRNEFITVLFTSQYALAAPVMAISLVQVLTIVTLSSALLRAFAEFRYFRLKLHSALLPVTVASLYIGIRTGGLIGVAISTVFVRVLEKAITTYHLGKKTGLRLHDLWQLAPAIRTVISALIASLLTWILKESVESLPPIIILAVCTSGFSVVFLLCAWLMGAITDEEKIGIRRRLSELAELLPSRFRLSSVTGYKEL